MNKVEEVDMYSLYSRLFSVMEALGLMEGQPGELDQWVWLLQATRYVKGQK